MIVECPACYTRYRISDSAALSEDSIFECTQDRCHKRFPCPPELFTSGPLKEPEDSTSVAPQREDDSAPNEPLEETQPLLQQQSAPIVPQTKAIPFSPPPPAQSATHDLLDSFDEEEDFSLSEEENPIFPLVAARVQAKPEAAVEEPVPYRKRTQSVTETTLSPNILLTFLGILLLVYISLSVYGRKNIEGTEALLARLPLIGPRFIASQFSAHHIALSDLKSSLTVTKDSKQILAIAGRATNTAPVPASSIQIEGTLYDATGKVIGRQQTFCGTETAVETLPNLTIREIGILQNLAPPKQFSVTSGQSISFLIVFVNPPTTAAELDGRVLTAQFRTPH